MKRLPALLSVVALLAMALAACGGTGGPSASQAGGLEGTSWTLIKVGDREVTADAPPTLAFDDDLNVSGSGGCNTFTGTARVEGSSIELGPLAMTQMACPGAAGIAETAFLTAMDQAQSFAIDSEGNLVLEGGQVLVFEPAETPAAS